MQKRLRGAAFILVATALSATAVHAQSLKGAIVNAQKSVADTQEIKKDQADLLAKYRPRQQDLEKLQNDLQQIQAQLKGPKLTPDKEAQLNADGTLKQKQLQRLSEDLQQDFNQ